MPDHDEVIDQRGSGFLEAAAVADMALPPAWQSALWAGAGSALAILLLQLAGREFQHPLLLAPFGASCVLLFSAPDSDFAQPRNVLFSYAIATLVGFAALWLFPGQWWTAAVAVGVTIVGMVLAHTVHPPAGAHPLVIVMGAPPLAALLTTLGAGLALLLLWAWAFHRLSRRA